MSFLIKNVTVVTLNNHREVIEDGAVFIKKDRIEAVGDSFLPSTGTTLKSLTVTVRWYCQDLSARITTWAMPSFAVELRMWVMHPRIASICP